MVVVINQTQVKSEISKIISYAKKKLPNNKIEVISNLIKLLYAYSSVEDINLRELSDLYGIAMSFWELMAQRNPHELKIRVFNPQFEKEGWQSTHTIVQLITEDMPFLVDSITSELNRLGFTMHLTIHTGGIKVRRNKQGRIMDVFPYETMGENLIAEAPIHIEIDKQTDPKILEEITKNLTRVLNDVRAAVTDWDAMRQRLLTITREIREGKLAKISTEEEESAAFLEWLAADNFTFLGARDYTVVKEKNDYALKLVSGSGLGVLRDETHSKIIRLFSEIPETARQLMLSKDQILLISKTNTLSTIHRPTYTDYIGVKLFNAKGELIGERRFIGLFTSTAYSSNPESIPLLRKKVAEILQKSKLPKRSHAGKDLRHIIATLPRDDLFQGSIEELYQLSMGISHLQERRRIRLFVRKDAYGRFVSCLVYIPRENFNSDLITQIQDALLETFEGSEISFTIHFSESVLARVHYLIRLDRKKQVNIDLKRTEQQLIKIGQRWQDSLREAVLEYFGEERGTRLFQKYQNAFPAGYRELFTPLNAVFDIDHAENLDKSHGLGMSFYRPPGAPKDVIRFKLFRMDHTVPLSDVLPMLENMGLRIIGEQPFQIVTKDGKHIWINDFSMVYAKEPTFEVEKVKETFHEAFNKIWLGEAENDSFNRLVLEAQLNWREITVLRAYAKYLRQTGFTFSSQYIAETLVTNSEIAKLLMELYKYSFDPHLDPKQIRDRKSTIEQLEASIIKKLDDVASLDEDRILRRYLDIMHATLRTNYFQVDDQGNFKSYLSLKFNPKKFLSYRCHYLNMKYLFIHHDLKACICVLVKSRVGGSDGLIVVKTFAQKY